MLFKLSNLNSNLALTQGYLNPALNNSAQRSNLSAMPPPTKDEENDYLVIQRGSVSNRTIKIVFDVT